MGAALVGVLLSTFLFASPAAHAATECGDPVEQTDGSWLILCNSDSYQTSEGDIVYDLPIDDIAKDEKYRIDLDGITVTPIATETSGVYFRSPATLIVHVGRIPLLR